MSEYFDAPLPRVREFRDSDGTPVNYMAEKFFTEYSEAVGYADSIRGTKGYRDVKPPVKADGSGGQCTIWAVFVLPASSGLSKLKELTTCKAELLVIHSDPSKSMVSESQVRIAVTSNNELEIRSLDGAVLAKESLDGIEFADLPGDWLEVKFSDRKVLAFREHKAE